MTLILSAISPRWAMQASDRRVTVLNAAGAVLGRKDERNKAIFVAERMTFADTGHADIGGTDTAEWFQAQLGRALSDGRSVDEALQEAAEMAAQYFRALPPHVDERAHAFVGVGWTADDVRARRPFIASLANSIEEDGRWRDPPGNQFHAPADSWPARSAAATCLSPAAHRRGSRPSRSSHRKPSSRQ